MVTRKLLDETSVEQTLTNPSLNELLKVEEEANKTSQKDRKKIEYSMEFSLTSMEFALATYLTNYENNTGTKLVLNDKETKAMKDKLEVRLRTYNSEVLNKIILAEKERSKIRDSYKLKEVIERIGEAYQKQTGRYFSPEINQDMNPEHFNLRLIQFFAYDKPDWTNFFEPPKQTGIIIEPTGVTHKRESSGKRIRRSIAKR